MPKMEKHDSGAILFRMTPKEREVYNLKKQLEAMVSKDRVTKKIQNNFRKGSAFEMFNKISEWTLQGGTSMVTDATNVQNGARSIKLIANNAITFMRKSTSLILSNVAVIKAVIYVSDPSKLSKVTFYFSNDTTYTNYVYKAVNGTSLVPGWNYVLLDTSKMTVVGSGTLNNEIKSLQMRVEPNSGQNVEVTFDALIRDEVQRACVVFTMDDNWATQYTQAYPILRKYGFRGTIAVISSKVGTANYMTLSQLHEVYDEGWDLVNHTQNHVYLGQLSYTDQKTELVNCDNFLIQNGFTRSRHIVVYPYGSYNSDTLKVMDELFVSGRSLVDSNESGPPSDYRLIKCRNLIPSVTVATAQGWIDEAINTGGTVFFLNHKFETPDADTMKYDPANFESIVSYVYSKKSQLDVVTYSEWLERFDK